MWDPDELGSHALEPWNEATQENAGDQSSHSTSADSAMDDVSSIGLPPGANFPLANLNPRPHNYMRVLARLSTQEIQYDQMSAMQ